MRIKLLFLVLTFSASLSAQLMPSYKMTKKYTVRELQEWLKKNVRPRFISPADFSISGQINSGWKTIHDMLGGVSQVGRTTGSASNKYNADVILDLIYESGRARLVTRTAFRNSGGLYGGGTASSFELVRAYIGYNCTTHGPFICDLSLGRRSMNKLYNSQMQFKGICDGVSVQSSYLWEKVVDLRGIGGVYVSNNTSFWLLRAGFFNIANLGFYFDYAYAHWGMTRPLAAKSTNNINVKFNTGQYLIGWDHKPKWLKKDLKVFAALIDNYGATINRISGGSKESLAGYVGFQIGSAKKKNDYSIQAQLQFCQLQAIPEWDMAGIGTGKAPVSLFKATSKSNVNNNCNFKGWEGVLLYSVTDNLTLNAKVQRSVTDNQALGQPINFTNFKLESQFTF